MTSNNESKILQKLEAVEAQLSSEGVSQYYNGIAKSINILKNRDKKAYSKIKKHIRDDFRMIYDNGHGNEQSDIDLDAASKLADEL